MQRNSAKNKREIYFGRQRMEQNQNTIKSPKTVPAGTFNMKIGKTTYVIDVYFSQTSKETMEDKVKRLIHDDVKTANF